MDNRLRFTAVLCCMIIAGVAAHAAQVPLYPGAVRQPFPDLPAGRANAICTCDAKPSVVAAWYKAELQKLGWTIESSGKRPGRTETAYSIMATHPERKWRVNIMVAPLGQKCRFVIGLTGQGVTAESIGGESKPMTVPKPETKPGGPGATSPGGGPPVISPAPTETLPPASGVWGELGSPFEAMLTGLERFCDQPTLLTARAASSAVTRYMAAATKAKDHAARAVHHEDNVYAAFSIFGGSIVDFDVSMIGALIEDATKTPARLPELTRRLKPIVERLRNKVRRAVEAPAQHASALSTWRRDPNYEAPPIAPTKDDYRKLGLEPPAPETTVTISRVWTPSKAFWAVQLKDTMIAQRCWNVGCPDGCIPPDGTLRRGVQGNGGLALRRQGSRPALPQAQAHARARTRRAESSDDLLRLGRAERGGRRS